MTSARCWALATSLSCIVVTTSQVRAFCPLDNLGPAVGVGCPARRLLPTEVTAFRPEKIDDRIQSYSHHQHTGTHFYIPSKPDHRGALDPIDSASYPDIRSPNPLFSEYHFHITHLQGILRHSHADY